MVEAVVGAVEVVEAHLEAAAAVVAEEVSLSIGDGSLFRRIPGLAWAITHSFTFHRISY